MHKDAWVKNAKGGQINEFGFDDGENYFEMFVNKDIYKMMYLLDYDYLSNTNDSIKIIPTKNSFVIPNLIKYSISQENLSLNPIYRITIQNESNIHFDLDGKGYEFDGGHCWKPEKISNIIKFINNTKLAEGNGNLEPTQSELPDRDWRADPNDGLRPLKKLRLR